jgi:hypothetical protein
VLYTIPFWPNERKAPLHGLTSVIFHVYSKTTTTDYSWSEQSRSSEPIIIILGMCGGRPSPARILQYSTDWVAHSGKASAYGTVSISGSVFLREKLLPLLAEVNASTTILPSTFGIEGDRWKLNLISWKDHQQRTVGDSPFGLVPGSGNDGSLRYKWNHQDKYHYEHLGGSYILNGFYAVSCTST